MVVHNSDASFALCLRSVTGIDLTNLGINGAVTSGLATMTELTTLALGGNNFGGNFPETWGSVRNFQKLQVLDLGSNAMTGTLPSAWGSRGSFPALKGALIRLACHAARSNPTSAHYNPC